MNDEQMVEDRVDTFDLNAIELTNNLVDVHQEGNFIVCKTDKGVVFRQSIPAGKLLTKEGDSYALIDRLG